MKTETIHFQSLGQAIPAYLAYPLAADGLPIVVVIQEVFGVNAHIRDVTERIAQAGYIAIAPHIYHRQVQNFEVGYDEAALERGRQYKNGTDASELLSDIQGAIRYAKARFPQTPSPAGCIGFCFGGHVAYLAATLPEIAATASFYGAGICHFSPGGGAPTLTQTDKIHGRLYAFFGLKDPLISIEDIDTITSKLISTRVDHRIFRYSEASHGFFCDQRKSYEPEAARDAWDHVNTLFRERLKGT